jgi:hypothetical protein
VRSDLQKIVGISRIETDISARICKFHLSNADFDLAAKLSELAKTNSHLAGWSMIEGVE